MPENKDVVAIRWAVPEDLPRLAQAEQLCFGEESWDETGLEFLFNDREVSFWLLEDESGELQSWAVWGTGSRSFQAQDIPGFIDARRVSLNDSGSQIALEERNPLEREEKLRDALGDSQGRFPQMPSGVSRFIRVMSIATLPRYRGSGLARQLLTDGLHRARERGYSGAVLEVRPRNLPARRLYESLGFVRVATLPAWFQTPEEDGEILVKQF